PVLEIMFGDFLALSMDSLINQATKYWFLTGEKQGCPLTIRSVVGAGGRFGAIHSQSPVSWFLGVPGLKIATPSNPGDARTLMKAAIRDDNPVLFFEHKRLYSVKGELNDDPVELGGARVVRPGSDLTIVSAMTGVGIALAAAEQLAADGIDAEVIDMRVLRPFDYQTPVESLAKTNRLLVLEEGPRTGGWSATALAEISEHALHHVDDIWRITTADLPIPFSPSLEDAFLPSAESVATAVRNRLGAPVGS
ncbi:MAG TPA: transketolase C-terminal domain-containing protein, partial [Solirubrobacterales bacterium]|nr:transketolase C-terminal domain-containing protein [Solirubrobacterales bacterium]